MLEHVGLLDETLGPAYFEDDDLLHRLHAAGIETLQVPSVLVRHTGTLTTFRLPEHREWLETSARSFEAKWGALPPPRKRYRRALDEPVWDFCQNCAAWPRADFDEAEPAGSYGPGRPAAPPGGAECDECASLRSAAGCAFY
ncbi:MAG TPA: hypothetical protein VHC67_05510 [Gaiellaceae bacterium]|nr:hypothetical protein [Gaiellaceae bacterium]